MVVGLSGAMEAKPRKARPACAHLVSAPLKPGSAASLRFEFTLVFIAAPAAAGVYGGAGAAVAALSCMFWASIILLSMTRNFHWSDLKPKDFGSERRMLLGGGFGLAAVAALLAIVAAGAGSAYSPARLLFLVAAAPTLELFCRALLIRRYGRLFRSDRGLLAAASAVGALAYLALGAGPEGAAFGALTGLLLTAAYLRTGQFLLSAILHMSGALSFWLLAPWLMHS